MTVESKKFKEGDYIESWDYQYWPKGHNGNLPEGEKPLLGLKRLNGRLLWRRYLPIERAEYEQLSQEIREARVTRQLKELKEHGLLKRLPRITTNGRSHS